MSGTPEAMAVLLSVFLVFRELMVFCLPDEIAGPGGWLIDSDDGWPGGDVGD